MENEIIDVIAENLKYEMTDKSYSQKELASEARISESILSRCLQKKSLISLPNLIRVCRALDLTLDEICPIDAFSYIK